MNGMRSYYLSRAAVALALGLILLLGGATWWQASLVAGAAIAWFLWAPRSGRYLVTSSRGPSALGRDERGRSIADRAARNAFVGVMLATATIAVFAAATDQSSVPGLALSGLVVLGMLVYFASDFWLRRRT